MITNEKEKLTDSVENAESTPEMKSKKHKFRVDKKHVQGFIAGIVVGVILFTGATAGIYPEFLKGTFTNQAGNMELQNETDMQDISVLPKSINVGLDINTTFVLDIPADKLNNVEKDNLYLSGFFENMKITEVKTENNKLTVNVQGTPNITVAYDSDTANEDGYIYVFGDSVKEENTGYVANVMVEYPRLTSEVNIIEDTATYDSDIILNLTGDTFTKTPTADDISLDGVLKNMQISNISQNKCNLSFHINGTRNESGTNAQMVISSNVFKSGLSVEKIFSVNGAPVLFSIAPITVEAPFDDTLLLNLLNDYYSEDISPDMITLGGNLKDTKISSVEYIDSTNINVTLCADELRKIGSGTISLSKDALQSGRTVTGDILIEAPSIHVQSGDDEILTAIAGNQTEYTLTIYCDGDDFLPTLTPTDFVLKGTLSSMEVTNVKWINDYKVELIIKGTPAVGNGIISVRTAALGGITGAECSVTVVDSADILGSVNLSDYLPDMSISFYDKDGNALDIPSAITDENGLFMVTVTSDITVDSIAIIKAKNDKIELSAPFYWEDRENIYINAFTTLMADSIVEAATENDGIEAVYKYLDLADSGYCSTNYCLTGNNSIFSHELFEKQANGNVNEYIKQLEDEMRTGKTRSFSVTEELSGETGGIIGAAAGWGLGKAGDFLMNTLYEKKQQGASFGPLDKLIQPSTGRSLLIIRQQLNELSNQIQAMQDQILKQTREVALQGRLDTLDVELDKIISLNYQYLNHQSKIDAEVSKYKKQHTNSLEPLDLSELKEMNFLFGEDGEVYRMNMYYTIQRIITMLAPQGRYSQSLLTEYYSVMVDKLPFEHNAGYALKDFVQRVTNIEAVGIMLYASYCDFNDLDASLTGLIAIYNDSIDKMNNNILPSKNIFNMGKKGNDTTTVRLNSTGKYYTFYTTYYKMRDKLIGYRDKRYGLFNHFHDIWFVFNQKVTPTSIDSIPLGIKDKLSVRCPEYKSMLHYLYSDEIDKLFKYRNKYEKNLTLKEFINKYVGINNLPDWIISKTKRFYYGNTYKEEEEIEVTFYDLSDRVYRTYWGDELYNKYKNWRAGFITIS